MMEIDQHHQDEGVLGFKMLEYNRSSEKKQRTSSNSVVSMQSSNSTTSSSSSSSSSSVRRRNALANIFENVKAEDVLLLNLDFEIGAEESREIERRLVSEKDYVRALDRVAQLLPAQVALFKSQHTMALIADELNNDLCEIMQHEKSKMLKTN